MLPLIALVVTLSIFRLSAAPSQNENLQSDRVHVLSAKAQQILAELKQTCTDLHLRFIGSADFHPAWVDPTQEDIYDPLMVVGPTIRLGSKGHEHDFTFRQVDDRLIGYENGLVDDLDENKVAYDKPDQPQWSLSQAITIGTAFKKIFVNPENVMLGPPVAEYAHIRYNPPKSYLGQWMISWPRVDSKGHPFCGDHVTIQIQEGFVPLGVGIFLTTPYVEEKGEPMKESEAILTGREAIKTKQVDRGFESYADGDSLIGNKFEKADLIIVLPPKDIKVLGGPSTGTARLAWMIWFRPIHSMKNTHPIYDDSYSVWVDAYTGKILGTEGWL